MLRKVRSKGPVGKRGKKPISRPGSAEAAAKVCNRVVCFTSPYYCSLQEPRRGVRPPPAEQFHEDDPDRVFYHRGARKPRGASKKRPPRSVPKFSKTDPSKSRAMLEMLDDVSTPRSGFSFATPPGTPSSSDEEKPARFRERKYPTGRDFDTRFHSKDSPQIGRPLTPDTERLRRFEQQKEEEKEFRELDFDAEEYRIRSGVDQFMPREGMTQEELEEEQDRLQRAEAKENRRKAEARLRQDRKRLEHLDFASQQAVIQVGECSPCYCLLLSKLSSSLSFFFTSLRFKHCGVGPWRACKPMRSRWKSKRRTSVQMKVSV